MRFSKVLYVVLLYANTALLVYLMLGMFEFLADTSQEQGGVQFYLWVLWVLLLGLSVLLQIVDAALLLRRSDFFQLVRSMMAIKVAAIPYFIVNFVLLAFLMVVVIGGSRGVGIVLVWVPFALTYVVFLPTSIYAIAALLFAHRYHLVGTGGLVAHLVLQCVYVLDLVGTAILWAKFRRYPRSTEAPRVTITYPPFDRPTAGSSGRDGAAAGAVEATA